MKLGIRVTFELEIFEGHGQARRACIHQTCSDFGNWMELEIVNKLIFGWFRESEQMVRRCLNVLIFHITSVGYVFDELDVRWWDLGADLSEIWQQHIVIPPKTSVLMERLQVLEAISISFWRARQRVNQPSSQVDWSVARCKHRAFPAPRFLIWFYCDIFAPPLYCGHVWWILFGSACSCY